MKEMVQRHKGVSQGDAHRVLLQTPCLSSVQHSDWILNHLVRNAFFVEGDYRVIKSSRYESHTGNPVPRSTQLLNRILAGRHEDDDKQPRFQ